MLPLPHPRLTVEPLPTDDPPDCPCCAGGGPISQGFVYDGKQPYAAYVGGVTGLVGGSTPLLAIVAGGWEDGSPEEGRHAVVFQAKPSPSGCQFRLSAATPIFWPDFARLGRRLASQDSALVAELRALAGLIVSHDERLAFLLAHGRPQPAFSAQAAT